MIPVPDPGPIVQSVIEFYQDDLWKAALLVGSATIGSGIGAWRNRGEWL